MRFISYILVVAVLFPGCSKLRIRPPEAPEIPCVITQTAHLDPEGYWYGFSHCDNTSQTCVYFITYMEGPYAGQVFRHYDEDTENPDRQKSYIFRDGEKYYLDLD